MFKKVSKTLLTTFALSILFLSSNAEAKKPTMYISDEERANIASCSDADVDVGDICEDRKGHYIVVDVVGVESHKKGLFKNKHTSSTGVTGHEVKLISEKASVTKKKKKPGATDSELEEGNYDDITVTDNGDGTVTICIKTTKKCEVKTKVVVAVDDKDDKKTRRGGDVLVVDGGGSRRSRDPRISAKAEFQLLYNFCSGEVDDLIDECGDNAKVKAADAEKYKAALAEAEEDLKAAKAAERDAYNKMLAGCRKDCVKYAVNAGACFIAKTDKKNYDDLIDNLSQEDINSPDTMGRDLNAYLGGQDTNLIKATAANAGAICAILSKIEACAKELNSKDAFKDCGGADWAAAVADVKAAKDAVAAAKNNYDSAVVIVAKLTSTESCTLRRASDVAKVRNCGGCKCLEKAKDSCAQAVADADQQLQVIMRTPYCATCGYDGGGSGGCQFGYGCTGVSKAAQMISAIGGVAVPLGLGIMNMAMWNKGINACTSMYNQQLEVSKAVGLPPTAPSCGGMGGFGAGFGGLGMGGGLNGMGGIGMNPYGMGGIYGGMGGMNPYGFGGLGGGISAGLNIGFGNGMPGMYNPYGGGIYGGLGGGLGGGINPYGMGGMMGGGMGMNPYGNVYGVQQQMYDAQMRMQQMANQNMVLQQSQMMGGMYGQMGGMYGINSSPYFNMGAYGGVNPYMNTGVMGNFTMNPWAYANTGTMGYNPYAYGGTGITGGISGGINLGFNTGFNAGGSSPYGYYGYNAYPSLATPPYAGYNSMYNSGYGPYGNSGMYGQTGLPNGNCGWQVGVQCGW